MQENDEWSRRSFLTGATWVAAAGIAAPLLASCAGPAGSGGGAASGGSTLEALRKQGFVNVGINTNPVYGFVDKSGRATGEAPEVARAVFGRLGVPDVRATNSAWEQLIPGLNARQFDMVGAGMYITPARCKSALFSAPDYAGLEAILVPKGNPLGVKTFADAASKNVKVAVATGAVEKDYAAAAGVKAENIVMFDAGQQMLEAVASGRVYAASLTDLTMKYLVQQNANAPVEIANSFQPVLNGKPTVVAGGFVFRQGEQELVDAFNRELQAIHDSGEWLKIVQPFGFTQENLPPKGLTTQQLCTAS